MSETDHSSVTRIISDFGKHLDNLIAKIKPDFIVPLETKGAILLELSLARIRHRLPKSLIIIYPRAFSYVPSERLKASRFLIIDDAVFSCNSLKEVHDSLIEKGVATGAIHFTALFDFTSGEPNKDYHSDIHDRISFPQKTYSGVTRQEALAFIHDQILNERMPSTYDHLLFEASSVKPWQYSRILSRAAEKNRLLNYFRRGAFCASAILLEDLFPGDWDFPPKLRLWYHPHLEILRVAPIASPMIKHPIAEADHNVGEIEALFLKSLGDRSDKAQLVARYDAKVFSARLQMLPYIYDLLNDAGVWPTLEKKHLLRYFPELGHKLIEIAANVIQGSEKPPSLPFNNLDKESESVFAFLGTAKELLASLKEAYESQRELGIPRKDYKFMGYTGSELFERLSKYTREQIHAAIDYCFDMNYASAFLRSSDVLSRALRATEINPKYHHAEVYAATIIYSQSKPTPAWLISKVFPIISNTESGNFDGIIVSKKGPFGDYSEVILSESSTRYWRDIPSDLWEKTGSDEDKDLKFKRKQEKEEEAAILSRDSRIASNRTPLEAALFLCNQLGYAGAVLLNITTGKYGGTDYIAHNLEKILDYAISTDQISLKHIKQHKEGALFKLELINELYIEKENRLMRLTARCTRLGHLAPLAKAEAEAIVKRARVFPENKLYEVLHELAHAIISMAESSRQNKKGQLVKELERLGYSEASKYGDQAKRILFNAIPFINNFIYALSCRECSQNHYSSYIYHASKAGGDIRYILAYDLSGTRSVHAKKLEINVEHIDQILHHIAENWIIALGGKLSKTETNSGDLRYGYFITFEDCLQAACWILYFTSQLSFVNKFVPPECAFGIAITRGSVDEDTRGNLSSPTMNWTGHCLKGKLKLISDEIAGKAGRVGRGYSESPVQIIFWESFPRFYAEALPITKETRSVTDSGEELIIAALDFKAYLEKHPSPWCHRHNADSK